MKYNLLILKLNTNNILSDNKENVNYIGPSYTSINSIKTDSEISFLYLSPDNKYLFAGFFNGLIEIFAIADSQTAISIQVILSLIKIQISQNNNRLLGIGYNPITNYIHTDHGDIIRF